MTGFKEDKIVLSVEKLISKEGLISKVINLQSSTCTLSSVPALSRGWTQVGEERIQNNLHKRTQNEPVKVKCWRARGFKLLTGEPKLSMWLLWRTIVHNMKSVCNIQWQEEMIISLASDYVMLLKHFLN